MKFTRLPPAQRTRRDAWVDINLTALEHNARNIRACLPDDVAMMAILKADGYGHGTAMLIPTLESAGVSMIGVASMDEAIQIREAGFNIPLLVIGPTPDWAIQVAADYDVQVTVFAENHLQSIKNAYFLKKKPINVHIKVDTGMHRIGVADDEAINFIEQCYATEGVQVKGVFSHFACGDDPCVSEKQLARFLTVINQLNVKPQYLHMANTAGALFYHNTGFNMVRLGIALMGYMAAELQHDPQYSPSIQSLQIRPEQQLPALNPIMGLKARIVHLQKLNPGQGLSYGYSYVAPLDVPPRIIATLPLGYADGIPRGLSNKMTAVINEQQVPQVGTITMDQLMIDVTDVTDVQVGDTVTLLDNSDAAEITLTHWAKHLSTIEYELMCGLRVRLPKVYTR